MTNAVKRLPLLLFLTLLSIGSRAQTPPAAGPLLTVPHVDATFGFEMQLPASWKYDRAHFPGPNGSTGLVRGQDASGKQTLQILVFRVPEKTPFADWLARFEKQITAIPGVRQVKQQEWTVPQRTAAVLEVNARVGGVDVHTRYLCVSFDAATVWMLLYAAPAADAAAVSQLRAEFEQLAGSLRVLYEPQEAEQLAAAAERGKALLRTLRGGANNLRQPNTERYYEIEADGKAVGYFTRQASREEYVFTESRKPKKVAGGRLSKGGRFAKEGLLVRERLWRFTDDGAAQFSMVDLFASLDFETEMMQTRLTRIARPGANPPAVATTDQCVREEDALISSLTTSLDRNLPPPLPPIRTADGYLSLAWVRLLPRYLGTAAGEWHAFSVYDAETRALKTYAIRSLGARPLPGGKSSASGEALQEIYAYETREGFAKDRGLIFTDAQGEMLRYQIGSVAFVPSTAAEMERKYGALRTEAFRRSLGGN